jgi:adenine/guanine/hypoxanthine permease
MAREREEKGAWFCRGDINAFWALFADNLANMIIIAGVMTAVFGIPGEIVFGRVLPGLGMALIFGLGFYAWQARKLAQREGRVDVTALPYGISTPVMFVYLFGVIGAVHGRTGDGLLAWQVGIAAAFVGGCLEVLGSVCGPWLKRNLPRAGMLGTLAGIALVMIAAIPLAEVFEEPLIGFPALTIIFIGLIARRRLPFGLPAGLVAIIVGTLVAFGTGDARISTEGMGLYVPIPLFGDLLTGLGALVEHHWVLAIVIPVEIYNFIETMNNVESAEAAGDRYPVRTCQVADGLGTIIGSVFGAPFPTTVYIGHPGYKKLGARSGYALAVGLVFFLGSLFGLVAFLRNLIPIAAVAPILVYIGLVITSQAFNASPKAHAAAVAVAMLPHVSSLLVIKWGAMLNALGGRVGESLPRLDSPELLEAMAGQGAHVAGHQALAGGAIVVGLIWGSLAAFLVDGRYGRAAIVAVSAAFLTVVGLIHRASLEIQMSELAWGYLILAAVVGGLAIYEGTGERGAAQ